MTKEAWERAAREIWSAAFVVDPEHTIDITRAVTGGEVFAWSVLTVRQIRALHRGLFATARLVH